MLILKQNSANSVPTPPAGKGTIFLDDSDTLSVKTSDGNVETFPTVAASNTQVVFIDGTSLSGNANFTYNKNTETLTLSGSLAAGNVKTDNLQYANGAPWDLSDPGGSNTQIQFNDDESFGGSSAFTFNKTTNAVSLTGNLSASNVSGGNLVSANFVSGTLTTAAQPNITSVGSLTNLNVTGNAVIGGNLAVNGNVTYVNVDTLQVEDPIIELGGGPNGAPLTTNDGKDRGTLLHYYTTSAIDAFMGWDNSNGEFGFGSNVSVVNDVVTFNALGNLRASTLLGNINGGTGTFSGNVQAGNVYANSGTIGASLLAGTLTTAAQPNITSVGTLSSLGVSGNITAANITANTGVFTGNAAGLTNIPAGNISGQVANALVAGTVYTNAQPNITSVGKLTSLLAGTDAASADFPNAISIFSEDNTGVQATDNFGLVGEATGDSSNVATTGVGVFGIGKASGGTRGTGVQGFATVTNSADTGAAVGVRGYATTTHSGGYNIGVLGNAAGSGFGNYAFYVQAGNIASIETDTAWDLNDNSATSLAFNSSGKANIIRISTVDGSEGVAMSGTLAVTGNITATAGIKTDNYYYANGAPVDFQQAGGTNTQIQFNDANGFGGSAAFTFNNTSNVVTMSGNLSVANIQASGDITTATLTSNGNANVGNLGTAGLVTATGNVTGGNLTTTGVVSATGNVSGGNITTAGVVSATGNVTGGNLTTAGAVVATGNVTGGNLTTAGVVTATGNISGGNVNTAGKVVASTLESNVATGTAPLVVASTTKVANLNADLLDGFSTATAATANTVVIRDADGSFSANIITGTLSGAATTAGTVTTAAQPNITSVGTLTSLGVNGTVTAVAFTANTGVFTGNAAGLTNIPSGNISGQVANALVAGTVYTNAQPNITSVGTLTSLAVTGNASAGNVNAGNLLTANFVAGTLTTAAQPNITSVGTLTSLGVTGNVTAGNVYANSGTIGASLLTGTLTTAAQPNVTSVGTLTSLGVSGNITAANITANTGVFTGNGSGLSALAGGNVTGQVGNALVAGTVYTNAQPNITSVGTLTSLGVSGTITAANITANTGVFTGNGSGLSALAGGNVTGQVGNALVAGTVYTAAQPNITSVGTLSSLSVTGTATAGNLSTGGNLTVSGTGSFGGNVAMGNFWITGLNEPVNATDAATKKYVDDVAQGLNVHDSCAAATPDTLANVTSGTITYNNGANGVGAFLSTTGTFNLIDGVNVQTSGTRILVKNEANLVHNGIYTYTNTTAITRAADFNSVPEVEAGDFTFVTGGTLYDNTGWVQTLSPAGIGGASDNIEFTQFSGAGTYNAGTGLTLTGSTFSVNASQTQVTALGTVTTGTWNSLVGSSATFAAGLSGANLASITGANVTGTVPAATVAGTVTTAAQPNITSVGTLTSLGVNGTVTAVAFTANTGVFTGNGSGLSALAGANVTGTVSSATTAGTVTTAAQPNITSVGTLTGLGVNGTITGVNITANTGVFTGNGSGLSAIAGGNVTGQVANALVAGTVYTAAQPNITSVGTLTSLAVTGNGTFGNVYANSGTIGASLLTGTLTTAAQPNITSVGTLSSLAVTGNASAGNLNTAGAVVASTLTSNVATGTAPLTVTSTTRVANLNVAYANVADNINVTTQSSGNAFLVFADALTGNVAETANAAFVANTSNGALYATTFIGALSGAATTAGTVTTAAQPNITSVGTLTGLGVNGTVTAVAFTANTGVFTGNGSGLSAIAGANVTGTVSSATTAGTVTTAAQPNITSVGTLSSLAVTGNATAGNVYANSGTIGASLLTGTLTTAAQPNITSVGTLTSLTVSGNLVCSAFFDASVNAAVSAAGTVQGNATVIASEINVVSTVASGAGVALPTAVAGVRVTLINTAANALLVYPASGGAINSLATNAAYSLPAGGRLEYVAVSTTQWYTLNATYG